MARGRRCAGGSTGACSSWPARNSGDMRKVASGWCRITSLKSGRVVRMGSVKSLGWLGATLLAGVFTPALAVTDAERVATYKEFRVQFDAKQYAAAQPLAEKLVRLTEEQYGAEELQLTNPLTNLATIHYKLGNYPAAIENY